ncbi:transglutaminase-like putative cysteine protease [Catenibacillus scindens]|uniref:Transglutaminase-like putative cysteine protease n=1 Tax=Catenibacillus scindens TaxID=673271 RepID=A0A7W8M687_9FIRM|nr:transglutaminase-like domain-containing protein [Catenibacillus scindens]MBB5265136.1 transglutaminase-like putative cysteine protease [Catenibacillus scindens]
MKKEDWTGIHFLEKTSYYDGKKQRLETPLWNAFVLLCMVMIQFAAFCVFFRGLGMIFPAVRIFLTMLILCAVFSLLSVRWQFFWGGVIIICAGAGIFAWLRMKTLAVGFNSIYERIALLVDQYYSQGTVDEGVWSGELAFEVYFFIAMLLVIFASICFWGLKSGIFGLFPGTLAIAGAFLVGQVPDLFWTAGFCFFGCILAVGSYTGHRFGKYGTLTALAGHFYIRGDKSASAKIGGKAAIFMILTLAAVVGLSFGITRMTGLPQEQRLMQYQQTLRDWTRENLHWFENWGTDQGTPQGGISGGDLASSGDLYYHGDEQLVVSVDQNPTSNMYIKAYVGDRYLNSRWESETGGEYSQFISENQIDGQEENYLKGLPYTLLENFGTAHITIEKRAVFGSYVFMPYGAAIDSGSGWVNDLYIQGMDNVSDFDYAPMIYPLAGDFEDLQIYAASYIEQYPAIGELESAYQTFVKEHYVQVPQGTKEMLDQFTQGVVPGTTQEKIAYVRQLLGQTCTYSLTPGDLPEGYDYTEYFLMENRRGYCMHFATAATLLLRNMGVPARYVEGYILVPGNFSPDDSGFVATVYDHQAHAWTEVYLDQVGWVPVEVTPTYYNSQELTGESSESNSTETESQSQTQTEDAQNMTEDTQASSDTQAPENETGDNGNNNGNDGAFSENRDNGQGYFGTVLFRFLWFGLAAAGIIILAALLILFRAAAVRKQRIRRMRQKNRSKGVVAIYGNIRRLLKICGFDLAAWEDEEEYYKSVEQAFEFIQTDDLKILSDLANAAAFSRDGVSEEQWRWSWQFYQRISDRLIRRQKWWKRLLIRYIYCC